MYTHKLAHQLMSHWFLVHCFVWVTFHLVIVYKFSCITTNIEIELIMQMFLTINTAE